MCRVAERSDGKADALGEGEIREWKYQDGHSGFEQVQWRESVRAHERVIGLSQII